MLRRVDLGVNGHRRVEISLFVVSVAALTQKHASTIV
jgi:hypothetical protein